MKKNSLIIPLLLLTASAIQADKIVTINEAPSSLRIGYVNMAEVMETSQKGMEIRKDLEQKQKDAFSRLEQEQQRLIQAVQDYKAKASTLNDVAREREETRITKMQRDLENKARELEEEFKGEAQRTGMRLAKQIEEEIIKVARREGFHKVHDTSTNKVWDLDPSRSTITTLVKVELDKEHATVMAQAKAGGQPTEAVVAQAAQKPVAPTVAA